MEMDTGEALLRAWLELAAIIWNRQMVSGMTFNEAVVSNLLLYRKRQDPAHPMTATELCEKTNIRKSQMNLLPGKAGLSRSSAMGSGSAADSPVSHGSRGESLSHKPPAGAGAD